MPAYGFPGVAVDPRGSRIVGIAATAVLALAGVGWTVDPFGGTDDRLDVTLLTEQVGEGIATGTDVRLDGVKVGSIASIAPADGGRQRIGLQLDDSRLFGLTDTMSIAYAPGNLFGISELELEPGEGGNTLADGMVVDLSGANAARADDATLSTLLRTLGTFTTDVLTPEFTDVVGKVAHQTKAFTPILQAIVTTMTSIANTQQYETSFLLGQLGSALGGLPPTVDGGIRLLYGPFINEYMQSDDNRLRLDATVDLIANRLIPSIGTAVETAQPYFGAHADMLAPLLRLLAGTVSEPQRSADELGVLLDRLAGTFRDTPDGPVLHLDVLLAGVPGLATPLVGGVR